MRQAFNSMNPGGWIEYMDGTLDVASMDGTIEGKRAIVGSKFLPIMTND